MCKKIFLFYLIFSGFFFQFNTCEADEPNDPTYCLPELTPFFPTLLANPQIIGYSAGYRFYDKVFKTPLIPISIGDQFPLYQFQSVRQGQLYIGMEACVWAIFEAKMKSLALINADYYVGIPLTYVYERFTARLRIFHESSHLGDELLMENKNIVRLNPSMEAIELMMAYNVTDNFTLFGGYGHVLRSDESFKVKPDYLVYGFNLYPDFCKVRLLNLVGKPFMGVYVDSWRNNSWEADHTFTIGYQFDKSYGHKLRIYFEAHSGHSVEGQFSRLKTKYLAFKILYGY